MSKETNLTGWETDELVRQQLNGIVVKTMLDGPIRVMAAGNGKPPQPIPMVIARQQKYPESLLANVHFIYVRRDGWTLGASAVHQGLAWDLHKDDWVAIIRTGAGGEDDFPDLLPIFPALPE